jgi:excisionase family DNA binding protein
VIKSPVPDPADLPPTVTPALLTVAEVARLLRVHPKTVHRLRRGAGIPCVRVGAQLRFDLQEVLRWLSARKEG